MAIEIHYEKRIINNVIREADSKSHRDYIVVTALAAMFLFALFAYGWQHYQWIQYGYRIEEARKKKEQLSETSRQLRLERAFLRNPERIDACCCLIGRWVEGDRERGLPPCSLRHRPVQITRGFGPLDFKGPIARGKHGLHFDACGFRLSAFLRWITSIEFADEGLRL